MCTGNENSKPIWNKFVIRKDIIESSQVMLNFCRTVYTFECSCSLITNYDFIFRSENYGTSFVKNNLPSDAVVEFIYSSPVEKNQVS